MAQNDKKDEFKLERMFGAVAKLQISSTFNELAALDLDFMGRAIFAHIEDNSPRFSVAVFVWGREDQ